MERTELREVVAVAGGDGGGDDGDGVMVAEVARWLTGLMAGPEQNITVCVRNALNKTSKTCLLYTSPSPRDISGSRMPSSA